MSDLDEELLDMVGGDSEDESVDDLDRLDEVDADEQRSPSQEAKQSVEKAEEPQAVRRGVAQKVKARRGRRRKQESEDEDAAGSPGREPSLGSGGIDESEGEVDGRRTPEENTTQYPLEGKYMSPGDREYVMSLPEVEREAILAERAEEEQKRKQDAMLRKAFAQSNAASKIKRKAEAAELEDDNRRTTRPKTQKRTALDDYKRAREQKGADRGRRDTARDRKDERSPSSASDRDADGESEVEWAEPTSSSRPDPPPELRDFERCRVGRSNFAKVCFYPGFEEAIKGCFARLSIGINRETGQNQYRMAQIRGFADGKPYQMENASGKRFTIDQYALVAQGPHEKTFPFAACSDSKFTESEYTRFTETLRKENMRIPPKKFLAHKLEAIHGLLNTQFTEETLQQKFANQRAMELKHDPVHVAKQKRKGIARRRAEAEQNGDEEEIQRCDEELEALDNSASNMNGAVKPKSSPAKAMHTDRLAQLNQTNRRKTTQDVRNALIAERKQRLKEREEAARLKKEADAAKANGQAKSHMKDLFGETPDVSRAGTPANGADTPKKNRANTPLLAIKKGPVGALKQKSLDDDVIGGLDLGIDVEI
ncbi:RNA polymerase-associated RTF1 [Lecanosticta acicola]|uniref:RNA polymerase-associated RTF1 n=1 Tax=Lecanosticta acicola TaxID=111012 RepID=A0AAI8YWA1_9PEZI|nr:RNA polymerase-associated RTF1 [Lecanosticta acicola]